jgi:hypothetical protein
MEKLDDLAQTGEGRLATINGTRPVNVAFGPSRIRTYDQGIMSPNWLFYGVLRGLSKLRFTREKRRKFFAVFLSFP